MTVNQGVNCSDVDSLASLPKKGFLSLQEVEKVVDYHRECGNCVVHCHGVFDLLHIGHLRHLKSAKAYGDLLIVSVTPDRFVNKGPGRPAFSEVLRAEALAELGCVDYVVINNWPKAVEIINLLRPNYYVKGQDYESEEEDITGGIIEERLAVEAVGGKLVFTNDIQFSSSSLINKHISPYTPDFQEFLQSFSQEYSFKDLQEAVNNIRDLKVLLVGESIIDEYQICRTLGKSGKDPILAASFEKKESFVGGVLAVANHVANFSDHVDVVTFLGNESSYEPFIREKLNDKIGCYFLPMAKGKSTIVKRRFVEKYPFQKLFEVYVMDQEDEVEADCLRLNQQLEKILPNYDVVIVTDYGHGMFSESTIDLLCEKSRYLAVNTQINAGNRGFNTINKYPRADFVSLSEHEARIALRSQKMPLEALIKSISESLSAENSLITRGERGIVCYDPKKGVYKIPALNGKIVDRVGSGDCVLAVTSLCAQQKLPVEAVGFIGCAAGAEAIQFVGNRSSVDRVSLFRTLEHCMK